MSTTLEVIETTSEAELLNAFASAVEEYREHHRSAAWRIGDAALRLQECKRGVLKLEADELRARANNCTDDQEGSSARMDLLDRANRMEADSALSGYRRAICEMYHIDPGYVANCVMLARFFPPSQRCESLTDEHHRVAMKAAGGAKSGGGSNAGGVLNMGGVVKARGWLKQAVDESLSASELRRRANIANATHRPTTKPEPDNLRALTAADEWAITYRSKVKTLSRDQRDKMLSLMQGLLDLAEALRAE